MREQVKITPYGVTTNHRIARFVEPGHWTGPGTPLAAWVRGNYHLPADSPCIDVGDPGFTPIVIGTDIDGQARIFGGRTDIGCDEVAVPVRVIVS